MAIVEIKVPKLPPDEDAFHLLEWKKMIGDVIAIDDLLIEVETSKVVLEVRSPSAGVLIEIVVVDGGVAVSNQVIAKISRTAEAKAAPIRPITTKLLNRVESLETSLTEALRRLDELQRGLPHAAGNLSIPQTPPAQTFPEVLKWLATQDRIPISDLRDRLLPLDLLTNSVINELNELALDLTGELALDEVKNEIVVAKNIINEVLAHSTFKLS